MASIKDIVTSMIILCSLLYLTRSVPFFFFTEECRSIETRYGSAINVELKVGLSPLHNKVYGDIVCKESGRRRAKQELPAAFCPDGLPGLRNAVVEFIEDICKPLPSLAFD